MLAAFRKAYAARKAERTQSAQPAERTAPESAPPAVAEARDPAPATPAPTATAAPHRRK